MALACLSQMREGRMTNAVWRRRMAAAHAASLADVAGMASFERWKAAFLKSRRKGNAAPTEAMRPSMGQGRRKKKAKRAA